MDTLRGGNLNMDVGQSGGPMIGKVGDDVNSGLR